MSDELIIQHLKEKELYLINELNKVRRTLNAFVDDHIGFAFNLSGEKETDIPVNYESSLSYADKVLYILQQQGIPMLVQEIIDQLHKLEPNLDLSRLHKNVSYNLSMLAKYNKVRKHAYKRRIKYSV